MLDLDDDARDALELARQEASARHDVAVRSEDLLVGLVRQGGLAGRILARMGVDQESVRALVTFWRGEEEMAGSRLPLESAQARRHPIRLWPVEQGYIAEIRELGGLNTTGRTPDEAVAAVEHLRQEWIRNAYQRGDTVPHAFTWAEDQARREALLRAPIPMPSGRRAAGWLVVLAGGLAATHAVLHRLIGRDLPWDAGTLVIDGIFLVLAVLAGAWLGQRIERDRMAMVRVTMVATREKPREPGGAPRQGERERHP
jgi:predicted RNase H-like HicB family nuclease